MIFPIIQYITSFPKVRSLKGSIKTIKQPSLNIKDWCDGNYQEDYQEYINKNIGFRPWFVRIHNQIMFTFFDEANAKGVIRGKNNYLYELNYINAYYGDDYLGRDSINSKVIQVKHLQNILEKLGKTFIVCISPGKGTFYPEYIPDMYKKPITDSTNHKQFIHFFEKYKINHIDMNTWFINMKDTSQFILYPKYGIHWSHYGMLLAADSLIRYTESKRNIDMPNIEIVDYKVSKKLKYTDYDIANGMNLMFQMSSPEMCYPNYNWSCDSLCEQPSAIVVSDSFYWSMFNIGINKNSFSLGGFWYYNKSVYPDSFDKPLNTNEIDIKQRILESDIIILMSTDANLYKFSWGFVDEAISSLKDYY
jgi:hypothetical protein